jgi:hypothetical protein
MMTDEEWAEFIGEARKAFDLGVARNLIKTPEHADSAGRQFVKGAKEAARGAKCSSQNEFQLAGYNAAIAFILKGLKKRENG